MHEATRKEFELEIKTKTNQLFKLGLSFLSLKQWF